MSMTSLKKMPTIPLRSIRQHSNVDNGPANPLPTLLQTPSGLAILELQGTINLPANDQKQKSALDEDNIASQSQLHTETPIGRLVFPSYDSSNPPNDTFWMKRVYLYVGQHQRLTGEVKKLSKPLAIMQRSQYDESAGGKDGSSTSSKNIGSAQQVEELGREALEIAGIVRYKILFSARPEPVSANTG
ncbi:hypothetical protein LOZ61_004942 [Ophidiomyces ophidiicola]|uniref:Uncharacterized protein n=1 Tax=Ophidiomyces ophidiicola TaxID=1387563 RepID=A0ACB8US44_9EURO|nr:hypothetical protein LOZ61_004942 [Ophidiomyces ophidiicola]KAI1923571.1 hypothetical protein LOZ60_005105 [Ophidiomyces ophidiicola]KAI1954568.1 hypothetical protein LOZ59_004856 [Ophidiomyces ophidiicola]KAI1969851.1 hypothetical protein LOZ56_004099 [Ophidiomyces ophidiicola]KAI2036335.1 hypothetical protein LOZ48_001007 [Ophidiomyces ophidiicola]